MKSKPSASGVSSGSGTESQPSSRDGSPLGAFSTGIRRLVNPISLRAASAEKVSTVATCAFQPKRPARSGLPGASSSGCTQCTRPDTPSPSRSSGSALAAMSASAMASIIPNAMLELVMRVAVKFASAGMSSRQASAVPNSWWRLWVSPGSMKNSPLSTTPKCVTLAPPQPPIGLEWHDWQFVLLKIGPMPCVEGMGVMYRSRPSQKRSSSEAVSPAIGSPARGCRAGGEAWAPLNEPEQAAMAARAIDVQEWGRCIDPL